MTRTLAQAQRGAFVMEILAGAGAALIGGVLWAMIVRFTGYEVGYVAWGIGLVVGLAVAFAADSTNMGTGMTAAGMAALGLLVGKLLIFQWAMGDYVNEEAMADEEFMMQAAFHDMSQSDQLDPEVKEFFYSDVEDDEEPSEELQGKMMLAGIAATALITEADDERKKEFAEAYMDHLSGSISYADQLKESLGVFDLLWLGLAVYTAFRVGSGSRGGGSDDDETPSPEEPSEKTKGEEASA